MSAIGGETDLQALEHPNRTGVFPRSVIKLKLHCGDYVFLYFLNNVAFFQDHTWIVQRSSQTSSQWSPQRSNLCSSSGAVPHSCSHTLTHTHPHFMSHTVPFKAFMHTLCSPTHTSKVSLLLYKSTEFLPDPIPSPLLFQHIFIFCNGNRETGWETKSTIRYMNEDIAKHQNGEAITLERLIKQE